MRRQTGPPRKPSVRGVAERDELVGRNVRLVWHTARLVARRVGRPDLCQDEDLIQDGMAGLVRAAELFDPARGVQFSTYACRAVFSWMMNGLEARDAVRVPRHVRGEARAEARERLRPRRLDPGGEGGGSWLRVRDGEAMAARVPAATRDDRDDDRTRYDLGKVLARCRAGQERLVMEGRARGLTLEEVGRLLGVTKERVRQIQVAATRRLRQLAAEGVSFEAD